MSELNLIFFSLNLENSHVNLVLKIKINFNFQTLLTALMLFVKCCYSDVFRQELLFFVDKSG